MRRTILCGCLVLIATATAVRADERVRQVQEELRKRNLYFGNVDGNHSPELSGALKRYQARKGFEVTGTVDRETATSLHVQTATEPVSAESRWPNQPVLKSDAAREITEPQRIALQTEAEKNPDTAPSPAPPAESPVPDQNLSPERVTKLIEDYLRDGETQDVPAQVRYYSYPIQYFDHGKVGQEFVVKDTRNYVRRWPERKYTLTAPVEFFASDKPGETIVHFTIAFHAQNKKHSVSGHTKNTWTIRPEADDLKIIALQEERVRE